MREEGRPKETNNQSKKAVYLPLTRDDETVDFRNLCTYVKQIHRYLFLLLMVFTIAITELSERFRVSSEAL